MRPILTALVAAAFAVLGGGCPGGKCSGVQASLNVCDDFGQGRCQCTNGDLDTCIPAETFTSNGLKVPSVCTPPNASYDCFTPGVGYDHPCCPGYTCVRACNAGGCPNEYPGCFGSACIKLSGTTTTGGQCLVAAFTCATSNPIPRAGCSNPVICCDNQPGAPGPGQCAYCLGGSCPGTMSLGTCASGSCTNQQAALVDYCCAECDDFHRCPVGSACQGGKCGAPFCGRGNFVVPCGNGYCPNNSTCTAQSTCHCNTGTAAFDCNGNSCGSSCVAPNYWCR